MPLVFLRSHRNLPSLSRQFSQLSVRILPQSLILCYGNFERRAFVDDLCGHREQKMFNEKNINEFFNEIHNEKPRISACFSFAKIFHCMPLQCGKKIFLLYKYAVFVPQLESTKVAGRRLLRA